MPRTSILTDDQVEAEIARLTNLEAVKLARAEKRLQYRRRQYMYSLRNMEKRGLELQASGVTFDNLESMLAELEAKETDE